MHDSAHDTRRTVGWCSFARLGALCEWDPSSRAGSAHTLLILIDTRMRSECIKVWFTNDFIHLRIFL